MLNNVPRAINAMARAVVMNHPNSINCQLFRKVITRAGPIGPGGNATMGGLGVLGDEDEEQFTYDFLGNGYALRVAGEFQAAPMMNHGDASAEPAAEFRFLVEAEEPSGAPGFFIPQKYDVMYLLLGPYPNPARLAFEIVTLETVSDIPPYSVRYVTNRRDDLHIPAE